VGPARAFDASKQRMTGHFNLGSEYGVEATGPSLIRQMTARVSQPCLPARGRHTSRCEMR
jgi:hypothetical protein